MMRPVIIISAFEFIVRNIIIKKSENFPANHCLQYCPHFISCSFVTLFSRAIPTHATMLTLLLIYGSSQVTNSKVVSIYLLVIAVWIGCTLVSLSDYLNLFSLISKSIQSFWSSN